jgi:hypothetical protein
MKYPKPMEWIALDEVMKRVQAEWGFASAFDADLLS